MEEESVEREEEEEEERGAGETEGVQARTETRRHKAARHKSVTI